MDIEVKMGELAVIQGEGSLIASAVGSCAVITLYEPKLKVAGLIHAMLPIREASCVKREALDASRDTLHASRSTLDVSRNTLHEIRDAKYVDTAIDLALEKMFALGAQSFHIEAKLVGGANMFNLSSNIGMENVESARKKLKESGIKVIGESTGGSIGRSVEFSASTGIVTVKIAF